ncbi:F-actin-capping protein subunit beta [Neolecta irregularis DAH-3]|uniref:F-actin-capping protein subunit beta n=1 Tax=Neolecta irregularis (strain DAH-3) TaxID=1198029 RepID=A0A1U7LJX6_NEOID|nr:F-actin-capping protein subunit beta [Neolecta irregularis DAH-3]|eukprot:OLL22966.1 F-actin-capping protein subunit beta [Neolecta irregularis DAH-3]
MQARLGTITNILAGSSTELGEGGWDSIHVFEALDRSRTAHYKLTSTIILHMKCNSPELGDMDLGGNMTRHVEQDFAIEDSNSHIANVGRMIEDMELKMRNLLQEVYFGKVKIGCDE